jgi:hypothetical protein
MTAVAAKAAMASMMVLSVKRILAYGVWLRGVWVFWLFVGKRISDEMSC